jgi:hypothetical protein
MHLPMPHLFTPLLNSAILSLFIFHNFLYSVKDDGSVVEVAGLRASRVVIFAACIALITVLVIAAVILSVILGEVIYMLSNYVDQAVEMFSSALQQVMLQHV